jgi:hypothetical protein
MENRLETASLMLLCALALALPATDSPPTAAQRAVIVALTVVPAAAFFAWVAYRKLARLAAPVAKRLLAR